mgnify:CR=1 FL=1
MGCKREILGDIIFYSLNGAQFVADKSFYYLHYEQSDADMVLPRFH